MNSTEPKYRIAYFLEPFPGDGLTKSDIEAHPKYGQGNWGYTDKLVVASIVESEDGSSSTQLFSRQHDGRPLPADEIYKVVMFLCRKLAMEGELGKGREGLCWAFFNANVEAMGHPPQNLEEVRKLFADD